MHLAFCGRERADRQSPNPVQATASREKVCYLCVYCMSSNLKFI